jgi:outer membrane protein assembly factor BamA
MRRWLAQPVLLGIACLLASLPTYAQLTDSDATSDTRAARLCPPLPLGGSQSSEPDISIAEVAFLGALQMPVSDRDQIATSLKQRKYTGSLDGVVGEAEERVRAAWHDRGYIKVQVTGNARMMTSSPVNQRIALSVHVDEGLQYRLGKIRFRNNNNKAVSSVGSLRALFPIANGDVFSREKVAKGLENLRRDYWKRGYINFTSAPDTRFDDEKSLIYLEIDMDEGKQFRVSSISLEGLGETARDEILRNLPLQPGQVYDQDFFELSSQRLGALLDSCGSERRLNERAGTVEIRFACGQCPVEQVTSASP